MRLYEYSVRKGIPSFARFITNPLRGLATHLTTFSHPLLLIIQRLIAGRGGCQLLHSCKTLLYA
jgi:hypothetical protein